jgi:hypothetical protein
MVGVDLHVQPIFCFFYEDRQKQLEPLQKLKKKKKEMDFLPKTNYDLKMLWSSVLKYLVSNRLRNCIWDLRK